MLCIKFELIPIKIGFFTNFKSCSKIGPKTLYYSTESLAKFCRNIFSSLLTRDDILSFSSQLSTNQSLITLNLIDGSISDDGVTVLAQSLQCNKTLQYLNLQYNPFTSASAQSLAELLLINKTLSSLCLHNTNIDTDGVLVLMESLRTNNTLKALGLDGQHKEVCSTLPYYEHAKDRIIFL